MTTDYEWTNWNPLRNFRRVKKVKLSKMRRWGWG